MSSTYWEPPTELTHEEIVAISDQVLARTDMPYTAREEIFRIRVADLNWDIATAVFTPEDPATAPRDHSGRMAGIFLLHGGGSDHRDIEPLARLLAGKFGFKVATMTYPGHYYLLDESRNWPGDTINPDGTVRTPLWCTDAPITPDQYDLVYDRSDEALRAKYGSLPFAVAREGSEFYARMGAWPWAFEEAMKAVCRRNFPVQQYAIYAHGHSTGGPFIHMLLQRVANIAGLVGAETSPFGAINSEVNQQGWPFPFHYLNVRSWRDIARYAGHEAGPDGFRRLPWVMEDVLETWEKRKHAPGFKAQHFITYAAESALAQGARVTAARMGLDPQATEALVEQYIGYTRPLEGPGVKPLPPLMYIINKNSRDHKYDKYTKGFLPTLARRVPGVKARLVYFHTGVHNYGKAEPGLPRGVTPAMGELWQTAITQGYYRG